MLCTLLYCTVCTTRAVRVLCIRHVRSVDATHWRDTISAPHKQNSDSSNARASETVRCRCACDSTLCEQQLVSSHLVAQCAPAGVRVSMSSDRRAGGGSIAIGTRIALCVAVSHNARLTSPSSAPLQSTPLHPNAL